MTTVTLEEAKSQLRDLIEAARNGEEVVISDDDRPAAKLVPIGPPPDRKPGSAKGKINMSDDFDEPLEDFNDYMP